MIALGVVAVRYRWGVVALGVVAGKETLKLNEHTKTHNTKIPLYKSIHYKYETPKILSSIFSTDSCLQSENGVSTSNTINY